MAAAPTVVVVVVEGEVAVVVVEAVAEAVVEAVEARWRHVSSTSLFMV